MSPRPELFHERRRLPSVPRDSENAAKVRAIVGIARELNIDVIAQGEDT